MLRQDCVLGRETGCDIVIPDRQVSRRHARLVCRGEGVFVEDLGSKNGTHCNGNIIANKLELQDGDVLQIALAQEFIFISAEATMPIEEGAALLVPDNPARLRLEKSSRQVWINGREVLPPLSKAQFHLMEMLSDQQGRVVPRKSIAVEIWGETGSLQISNQALDALIRRLRERLAEYDPDHDYILTVRGHGLRMNKPAP